MPDPASLAAVSDLLGSPKRIAVLGAHPEPHRPAHYVPAYMLDQGWTIIPVNPTKVGLQLFGEPVRSSLAEAGPIDLVDVFRPSHALPSHRDELIAAGAPVVWFQLGIQHDEVAAAIRAHSIRVIQDRCLLADHRAWKAGRVS